MGIPIEYKTVLNHAVAEYEEKRSRFITSVRPVSTEEEAVEFINQLKAKYWDATHNVYAYHIGGDSVIQRFSDDGEPSGTAGLPVLEVIKRMELQDVVVVVTRYFGGTLLGAAGLIRAYGKSALLGIEASGIVTKKLCEEIHVTLKYPVFGKVQNQVLNYGYTIKDIKYTQDVEMYLLIPIDERNRFIEYINEATNGEALLKIGEKEFVPEVRI